MRRFGWGWISGILVMGQIHGAWQPEKPDPRSGDYATVEERFVAYVEAGEAEIAMAILNEDPDPDRVLGDGRTPLMVVAAEGMEHVFFRMIELHGGHIEYLAPRSYSMVMAAGEGGNARIFDYLYQRLGTRPAATDDGFSIPMAVARGGNLAIFNRIDGLFAAQPIRTAEGYTLLMAAAEGRNERIFNRLLERQGVLPNAVTDKGWTLLHAAAKGGSPEIVGQVLGWLPVDPRDAEGRTPLWVAARHNRTLAAGLLLRAGADPRATSASGVTTLMLAIENANRPFAGRLLDAGVPVNAQDRAGVTALHRAIALDNVEDAIFLVGRGADVRLPDHQGETPLHYAVRAKSARLIAFLLRRGADPHAPDADGRSALTLARELDYAPALRLMREALPPTVPAD